MKRSLIFSSVLLLIASFLVPFAVNAQMQRISPHDTVTSVVNGAHIKLIFGSPAVKGR